MKKHPNSITDKPYKMRLGNGLFIELGVKPEEISRKHNGYIDDNSTDENHPKDSRMLAPSNKIM